jgi:hypothetical protein
MTDLYEQVERRIDDSPALEPYREVILYDWPEGEEHLRWVLTAPEAESVSWAAAAGGGVMARLREGERLRRMVLVHLMIREHPDGISEARLAEQAGLERRTINNYLRELEALGSVRKHGLSWTADTAGFEELVIALLLNDPTLPDQVAEGLAWVVRGAYQVTRAGAS